MVHPQTKLIVLWRDREVPPIGYVMGDPILNLSIYVSPVLSFPKEIGHVLNLIIG
jgi:hypothetical protein